MNLALVLRALANERRLRILGWLADPVAHFPPQVDGDLVKERHPQVAAECQKTVEFFVFGKPPKKGRR